ncbi:MAG: sigma-54 dependent transcriptional regulator [Desulfobacterales bacterium]|jgi:DNA-binding NtrC family response regulator|nr:sigma-54 dependent transcriptional regulator [Desulfobacterales bacterium]
MLSPATKNTIGTGNNKPVVLIVDDEYCVLRALCRLISPQEFIAVWVAGEQQGLEVLKDQPKRIRIIIIDLKSSGMGGAGFLQHARHLAPHAAVLITAPLGPFLYQGGNFYELSGPNLKQDINGILLSITQKLNNGAASQKKTIRKPELKERFGAIIGRSESINAIYRLLDHLQGSSSTVLIQGESGTGKELIAQTIHQTSPRESRPFVAINCGAIPANLIESELFGHERGAFTTAVSQRKGKFEVAEGGTLFLDEVGELDRELQVKLLRVLQEKEFQRVGGNVTYKTDVRIVAATSQDLNQVVQAGHFRDDLFYRLNVIPVHVPPLRERKADIPLLLDHFFNKTAKEMGRCLPDLSEEILTALTDYRYPGNVRELANIVERLLTICPDGKISLRDLPKEVREEAAHAPQAATVLNALPDGGACLSQVEKELILKTLEITSGNKSAAARMIGITRRRLYLRLSQYGLASA